MAKKTNKTSHVLSLLTNGADPEETSGQDLAEERNVEKQEKAVTEAAPMEPAPQISASGDKRVVVVEDQEEDISNKILDNLEKQLESQEAQKAGQELQDTAQEPQTGVQASQPQTAAQEESQDAAQAAQTGVQESQPQATVQESQTGVQESQPQTAAQEPQTSVQESQSQAAAQEPQNTAQESQTGIQESQPQAAAQESQTVAQESQPAARGAQDGAEEYRQIGTQKLQDLVADFGEEECHIENVMENIISRTDLKKYMDEYGVCKCSRCCADVKALILTRLPSKYVVVQKDSVAPMIGFYENKFRVMIFTEILKACLQVKEKPRHNP